MPTAHEMPAMQQPQLGFRVQHPGEGAGQGQLWRLPLHSTSFRQYGLSERDVVIWLPPGYTELRSYPVIYAFDGQNLMNPSTSFRGMDWQLGAVTSALINKGAIVPPIIVLLNNIGWPFRYFEYGDTDMGRDHLGWIVNELKPKVDSAFSTLRGPRHTFAIGSSMGGTAAFLSVWRHPEIFGGAGCLSPVFHLPLLAEVGTQGRWLGGRQGAHRLYIDNGGDSFEKMAEVQGWSPEDHYWGRFDTQLQPGVEAMLAILQLQGMELGSKQLKYFRDSGAHHSEDAWGARAWRPLQFLLDPLVCDIGDADWGAKHP
ncbi:hypothetical protein CYMTET_21089 [Cymbomonas tetramitiformis]|uniref:Esterase n=1 Tax=Cymbomonas tetramitiformis TaxID=36881 RepID=A0AAE0CEZ5_9CHLO|nr:hypothetical protein CYMTET_36960 [Cymbomonas tetramitiformis]KAK3270517.1 hypothetical protein CYMTET_21089 [Cymbomonas tetramitiformis]